MYRHTKTKTTPLEDTTGLQKGPGSQLDSGQVSRRISRDECGREAER